MVDVHVVGEVVAGGAFGYPGGPEALQPGDPDSGTTRSEPRCRRMVLRIM